MVPDQDQTLYLLLGFDFGDLLWFILINLDILSPATAISWAASQLEFIPQFRVLQLITSWFYRFVDNIVLRQLLTSILVNSEFFSDSLRKYFK